METRSGAARSNAGVPAVNKDVGAGGEAAGVAHQIDQCGLELFRLAKAAQCGALGPLVEEVVALGVLIQHLGVEAAGAL